MAEDWVALLRARGYRMTQQRRLVLDAVGELRHATPEQVHSHIRAAGYAVDLATVYRTLELLVELDLVGHARLDSAAETYHLLTHADHVHLICRRCGNVSETPVDTATGFAERLRVERGFEPDLRHLVVFGRCADCGERSPT